MNNIIGHNNGQNILLVGIGNVLKKDDGVGVYISQHIGPVARVKALTVEMSIENYIGKINTLNPEVLILADCMDLGAAPGHWDLKAATDIAGHTTNTHNISLEQVSQLFHCPVYILGIQPLDISFGEGLSPQVRKTADALVEKINRIGDEWPATELLNNQHI